MIKKLTFWQFKIILILFFARQTAAQDGVLLGFNEVSIEAAFLSVGEKYNVFFLYPPEIMTIGIKVTFPPEKRTLVEMLDLLRRATHLQYDLEGRTVTVRRPSPAPVKADMLLRGRVLDTRGTPLAGVTIRNQGKGSGGITGESGEYGIHVVPGDQLSFSLVGYRTQQVKVSRKMPSAIILEENVIDLKTTIVTGYTVKNVEELTGSLQKLGGQAITHGVTSADATSMIKGRVAGVYITEQLSANPAGAGGKMLMRGQGTLLGAQAAGQVTSEGTVYPVAPRVVFGPLIVIDGIISPYSELKDAVNPRDIGELVVLKDAAATAIYGSRAAAGVIDIVTRRGKPGKMQLTLETKIGLNSPNRGKFRWMNADELYDATTDFFTRGWAESGSSWKRQFNVNSLGELLNKILPAEEDIAHSFDWSKYYYVRSLLQEVNISASGGNTRSRYYFAIGHYYEQGTIRDNGLRRSSFRLNLDQSLSKALSLSAGLNGILDQETQPVVLPTLQELPFWLSPYDANGALRPWLSPTGIPDELRTNFLFERQFNSKRYRQDNLWGNLKLTYRPVSWLSISSNNAGNLMRGSGKYYADARSLVGRAFGVNDNGFLLTNGENSDYFITSNTITVERRYEKHWLRVFVGQEYQQILREKKGVDLQQLKPAYRRGGTIGDEFAERELPPHARYGTSLTWEDVYGGRRRSLMFSLFSGAAYSYRNRYFISASLRNDASSEFSPHHQNAAFWSVGASWLINREPFMQARKAINLLKLRVNTGTSGSQGADGILTQTLFGQNNLLGMGYDGDRYNGERGVYPFQIGDPDLRWEITRTLNAGLDVGLLDRIAVSLDYYRKRSFGLIQQIPQSAASGNLSRQFRNTGVIGNYGFELTLNTQNISGNKFSWSSSFNIAVNKNRIISVYGGALMMNYGILVNNEEKAVRYYLYPGEDINTIKGVIYAGVDQATGKPLFEKPVRDGNGNIIKIEKAGSIAEALGPDGQGYQTLGTKTPKFNGGFLNTIKYRNFTLSMLTEFVYGTHSLNADRFFFQAGNEGVRDGAPIPYGTMNRVAYAPFQRPWRYPGDKEATMPSIYEMARYGFFYDLRNSCFYEDNSFLRIRNIRLDYQLPKNWLDRYVNRAEIYLSIDNLYTFTSKYFTQVDPEGAYVGGNLLSSLSGVGGGIGLPRRCLIGMLVNFK
jgi:TonB-linked SusC/RagA family outer membrane protein